MDFTQDGENRGIVAMDNRKYGWMFMIWSSGYAHLGATVYTYPNFDQEIAVFGEMLKPHTPQVVNSVYDGQDNTEAMDALIKDAIPVLIALNITPDVIGSESEVYLQTILEEIVPKVLKEKDKEEPCP